MKRLLLIFVSILLGGIGSNAYAQYADANRVEGNIKYSFGAYKNAHGDKIKKDELKNYFDSYQYADYQKAARKFRSGIVLTSIGVVVGGLSAAYIASAKRQTTIDSAGAIVSAPGYIAAGGAVICAVIGIPKIIIGNSKLNKIANDYNNSQTVSMSFGYQPNGIGLAINF